MLNLFRCSSAENVDSRLVPKSKDDSLHYFVTDYFDEIKVEKLKVEETSLRECMGIMQKANTKKGVSHQRYCLYSETESEKDLWDQNEEYPLLMIIQSFINPELYQASIKVEDLQNKLSEYIKRFVAQKENEDKDLKIRFHLYRLLTSGDFAVIIRSNRVHAAYDISTAIRSIRASVKIQDKDKVEQDDVVFYTYSICGVYDVEEARWSRYLSPKDKVVVRLRYSRSFRKSFSEQDAFIKTNLLRDGYHLLGRYDHQISLDPREFEELYPYIRQFKTESEPVYTGEESEMPKVKLLVEMLKGKYISHINERLLLKYEHDNVLEGSRIETWEMECSRSWISLYEKNNCKIEEIEKNVQSVDGLLQPYYQSDHNLKEYIRLLGRMGRVFYEINKRMELRISLSHLLVQYKTLVQTLSQYVSAIEENQMKYYTATIAEYLRQGIGALEIFTRYMRNVNLHTLQTPNYDLQTNVSVMKLLLAYSQFLRPYVTKREEPYTLTKTFCPIIVPSMRTQDMSVAVLFDVELVEKEDNEPFLMVVFCPTFSFLCETCFLTASVFHEIAHQFRYEKREIRNKNLIKYIVKDLLKIVVGDLVDEKGEFDLKNISFVQNVVNTVYTKCIIDCSSEKCLQEFKREFIGELSAFVSANVDGRISVERAVTGYLNSTRDSIQSYSDKLLEAIYKIDEKIAEDKKICQELLKCESEDELLSNRLAIRKELERSIKELNEIQGYQIRQEISAVLKSLQKHLKEKGSFDNTIEEKINDFKCVLKKPEEQSEGTEAFGRILFEKWTDGLYEDLIKDEINDNIVQEKVQMIIHLLKQYHNVYDSYVWFCKRMEDGSIDLKGELLKEVKYQDLFSRLCATVHKELLDQLNGFIQKRSTKLDWSERAVPIEHLQYVTKELRILGENGIREKIKNMILRLSEKGLEDFVDQKIELYREVTSDLFMCAAMKLNIWGYLVVVSEMFDFKSANRDAQLQRVFLVGQCLCKKGQVEGEFREEVKNSLVKELKLLNENIQETKLKDETLKGRLNELADGNSNALTAKRMDDLREILSKCEVEETEPFASTRNWIIRIYLQIISIIPYLLRYESSEENIADAELFQDISSESSYYNKKEEIRQFLEVNKDERLCDAIAEVLNSPASHFRQKKSLLQDEIEFIFDKYELCCKNVFEDMGE